MREFDDIYVSWRSGAGKGRHIIGVLKKYPDGKFTFTYDISTVAHAKEEGFLPYTEFPDITQKYNGSVLEIFAQRLMKSVRTDIKSFYDFWEIEPSQIDDKFCLLGHTQGLLPTDNFEFLADYNPIKGLHFLTDLAHLTETGIPANTVKPGDVLQYEKEEKNVHDPKAIRVLKSGREIGYIKKIHSHLFHKQGAENLQLTVKAVDQSGVIKRVFLKVANP